MVSGIVVTGNKRLLRTDGAYLGDDMQVSNLPKDGSVMPYRGYVHPVLLFGI